MDYHAIGEGWCENLITCPVLACSYRIGFYVATPLPGCTRLEALSGNKFRDGLQSADRFGMSKLHKTWDFDGLGSRICSALSVFASVSSLQTKSDVLKTGNRGCGKAFWTLLPHNSDYCDTAIGFKIKILARPEGGGCIVIRQRPITQPKPLS
jgi:hypothetical protein